ncbi:hypothetical protein L6472_05945 [Prevotella sp. E13-17]|uniref:hypothetical protein n=1 Tax=Prevotella sp. E13-17 TaxID=2913616 RepID=UPI001EDA6957|nr:hypothetical protein [Prevotella sp. E13-17]UKK52119.1 hypothetical protein L6472_05945 [Prevotella sp. E13-17]
MSEQIYHILITEKCNYQCPLCCNNFYDIGNLPTVTTDMLREAHTVCITGGEPLIHGIGAITGLCQGLREQYPNIQKLYLYTSGLQLCNFSGSEIGYLYRFIDGINVSPKSRNGYHSFARFIKAPIWKLMPKRFANKTNRLYVFEEQLKLWEEVKKEYDIHLDGTWQVIGRYWDTTFNTPDNEHFVRLPILF